MLITTLQGIGSKVIFSRGKTSVFGKSLVQLVDVKNQSNCLRRGLFCMLLHVYDRPFRGNSTSPRWPIASLKVKSVCTSRSVMITERMVKLEVTKKTPIFRVQDVIVMEPLGEFFMGWIITRAIDQSKFPKFGTMNRCKIDCYTIALLI